MTDMELPGTECGDGDDDAVLSRPANDVATERGRLDDGYAALIESQPSDRPLSYMERDEDASPIRAARSEEAFIYWRSATGGQDTTQCRQVADCNAYAAKIRRHVGGVFGDAGKSGTSMAKRTGLQDMMAQVRRRRPKLVIVEHLDRLSRKLADLLDIFSELTMLGVGLHDVAHGKLDRPQVIILGLMSVSAASASSAELTQLSDGQSQKGMNIKRTRRQSQ